MNHRPLAFLSLLITALFTSCSSPTIIENLPTQHPATNTPMNKRIVMFFDGTRNLPDSNTNVHRLFEKVKKVPVTPDGREQKAIYMQGVGTRMTDIVSGAAFGRGISRDVRDGYEKLRAEYQEGDEIWIFGFSRGAMTARSVAGFLAHYGVLHKDSAFTVKDLYTDYRTAKPGRVLAYLKHVAKNTDLTSWDRHLVEETHEVDVEFLGVWDTVATIGLPIPVSYLSRKANNFHMIAPRGIYKKCRQALALDEFRPHYSPVMWKRFVPLDKMVNGEPPPPTEQDRRYEQRWFPGAHSNVGGGYKEPSALYKLSLRWMEQEAAASGLVFADPEQVSPSDHLAPINDSFASFFPYKIAFWTKRTPRLIQRGREKKTVFRQDKKEGYVFTLNETIDDSVLARAREAKAPIYIFPRPPLASE